MSKFAGTRGASRMGRLAFRLSPVAAGVAVMLSSFGAYAQQVDSATATADANSSNTVVVTGIRKGIEDAISAKKSSNSIVEAISAEDVGKLPDTSVADSISRLPGVTSQRTRNTGKSAGISVRGMSPDFNGTLLNGREIASTGEARSPEFDLFPAELITGATINKTPDATLMDQGLASTINLTTARPLDFGKRVVAVNYRRERSGIDGNVGSTEGHGDHISFSYVDQFMDRKAGLAVSLTQFKDRGAGTPKFNSWGSSTTIDIPDTTAPADPATGKQPNKTVTIMPGIGFDTETENSDRTGASVTFQYKPSKNFKTTIDYFHSSGNDSLKKTGLEGSLTDNAKYDPTGTLTDYTLDANGVVTSGTMSNFKGVVRNHLEKTKDKLDAIGWNSELKVADWTVVTDLSHSYAKKIFRRFETTAGQPGDYSGHLGTYNGYNYDNDKTPLATISWTGYNGSNPGDVHYTVSDPTGACANILADRSCGKVQLTDVNGWGGGPWNDQAGYVALPTVTDKVSSARAEGRHDLGFGPLADVTFGANFTKRDKERRGQEGRLVLKGDTTGVSGTAMPGTDVAVAGKTGIPIMSWDPDSSLGSIYTVTQWVDASTLAKDWSVEEKNATLYAQSNLDGELFGLSYHGNIGAQYVHTNQASTGNKTDGTCVGITDATCPHTVVTSGDSYNNFLPSANLIFDFSHDQVVRLGLAKEITRPKLDDLSPGFSFGVKQADNPILSGSGGNPHLRPYKARAADISYEKYFGNKGYVSADAFYKKLDTYITNLPMVFDFAPYVSDATPLPTSGPYKGSTVGFLTMPTNGHGGNLHGYELAVNVPFSLLTPILDGFGLMANYSDTKSSINIPVSQLGNNNVKTATIPLPGLSRRVTNARAYYEKYGVQVALAARKRSDFLGTISDYQDNQTLQYIKGDTQVDAQLAYEFSTGFAKGLTVLFQANNLNNAPYREYTQDPSSYSFETKPGKQFLFGVNYKL